MGFEHRFAAERVTRIVESDDAARTPARNHEARERGSGRAKASELEGRRRVRRVVVEHRPALHRPAVVELPDERTLAELRTSIVLDAVAQGVALIELREVAPFLECFRRGVVELDVA